MPPTAGSSTAEPSPAPVLYLDVGHPWSLLAAERALQVMPVATEWIPVDLGDPGEVDWDVLTATAAARGLQPIRRPAPFPFAARQANLAATYAKSTGRAVAFLQAALRQAYAGGRDLSEPDGIVIAGSACELHPRAVLKALDTAGTQRALDAATALARERDVRAAPAVWADGRAFAGDAGLDAAAAWLTARGAVSPAAPPPNAGDVLSVIAPADPR